MLTFLSAALSKKAFKDIFKASGPNFEEDRYSSKSSKYKIRANFLGQSNPKKLPSSNSNLNLSCFEISDLSR